MVEGNDVCRGCGGINDQCFFTPNELLQKEIHKLLKEMLHKGRQNV